MPYYVLPEGVTADRFIEYWETRFPETKGSCWLVPSILSLNAPKDAHAMCQKQHDPSVTDCARTGDDRVISPREYYQLSETDGPLHVQFVLEDWERDQWRRRERMRFADNTYARVPWADHVSYEDTDDPRRYHYAHLSIDYPGKIAYTKNDEHGIADRQTVVKPGKYLTEFYADQFTKAQIDAYVAECATFLDLKIAASQDETERAYTRGPRSCCSRHASRYAGHCHPARVYGGEFSDLRVAYLGDLDGTVTARCIIWPEKKIAVRVYGDKRLCTILKQHGYTDLTDTEHSSDRPYTNALTGAKIAAIEDRNGYGWIMPYIDGIDTAYLLTDHTAFILGKRDRVRCEPQGYSTQDTRDNGGDTLSTGVTDWDGGDEDDHEGEFYCNGCDNYVSEDDHGGDGYCQSCYDERHFTCAICDHTYPNEGNRYHQPMDHPNGDDTICSSCYEEHVRVCGFDTCDNTWIEDDLNDVTQRDRRRRGVTDLCPDCGDSFSRCDHCHEYTAYAHADACEHCQEPKTPETPRCEYTADLPLEETETEVTAEGIDNAC